MGAAIASCWLAATVAALWLLPTSTDSTKLVPRAIVEAAYSRGEVDAMVGGRAEAGFVALGWDQAYAADARLGKAMSVERRMEEMRSACAEMEEQSPSYQSPPEPAPPPQPTPWPASAWMDTASTARALALDFKAIEARAQSRQIVLDRSWSEYQRRYQAYNLRYQAHRKGCEAAIAAADAARKPGDQLDKIAGVTMSTWVGARALAAGWTPSLAFSMPALTPAQREALAHPSYRARLVRAVAKQAVFPAITVAPMLALLILAALRLGNWALRSAGSGIARKGSSMAAEMIAASERKALGSAARGGSETGGPGAKTRI